MFHIILILKEVIVARIYIRRNPDGTFRVRGVKKAGKQIEGLERSQNVPAEDVGRVAGEIMRKMGNRGDRVRETTDTAGERGIT